MLVRTEFLLDHVARRWRLWVALLWLAAATFMLFERLGGIRWFALGDTDDNLRMMQVRALIEGQDWFDLRQYRLNPPFGADIHWSRLVDLPIAGIKLALAPMLGGPMAERVAVTLAPMLPMAIAMVAVALVARRLIGPLAYPLAIAMLLCGQSTRLMWAPLRIDHHGWQLAALSLAMAALADPRRARGGVLLGLTTALSLSIGLEMLIYCAAAGAIVVLMWLRDPDEGRRLAAYGASLAGGSALGYLLFASQANRAPVCDALSPVWLSAVSAAGALCLLLALTGPRSALMRAGMAALGGLAIAAALAWMWPHCLGKLEGVSPEAQEMWLDRVREARPIYTHDLKVVLAVLIMPLIGLVGYALALWKNRSDPARLVAWAALGLLGLLSVLLLFWQTRAGPAAQLLSVPGVTALGWTLIGWFQRQEKMLVRVLGTVAVFTLVSGVGIQLASLLIPDREEQSPRRQAIGKANRTCPTLPALRPVGLQPRGYVLTFVDLGPRLITVTHHDAVAGPYHRNDDDIVDVMKAFRGTPEAAHAMIERRGIDYVLICPDMSESTVYQVKAPDGFYMQLVRGNVPEWLSPVPLPSYSPYRMWRVVRPGR